MRTRKRMRIRMRICIRIRNSVHAACECEFACEFAKFYREYRGLKHRSFKCRTNTFGFATCATYRTRFKFFIRQHKGLLFKNLLIFIYVFFMIFCLLLLFCFFVYQYKYSKVRKLRKSSSRERISHILFILMDPA